MIAHLVTDEMKQGRSPVEAVDASLPRLRGAFALAFLFAGEEDLLIGARKGSPLAIGPRACRRLYKISEEIPRYSKW